MPDVLAESCRAHGVVLVAVPAQTSFRDVTEAVYLRQWGELSRRPHGHYALPGNVRGELAGLLAADAAAEILLERAFAHLGGPPCHLLTATGRTIARTPAAPELTARQAVRELAGPTGTGLPIDGECGPYDSRQLRLPDTADVPPRVLHEIAEVLARCRRRDERRHAAGRRAADELLALAGDGPAEATALRAALHACGLPATGPYRMVVATAGGGEAGLAVEALAESLRHSPGEPFAAGRLPGGEAAAVVRGDPDAGDGVPLGELWPLVHRCAPRVPLHAGVSGRVAGAEGLNSALHQARYALAAARPGDPDGAGVTCVEDLSTMGALLAGVPADVRTAFSTRVLGPLAHGGSASHRMLLETLETFLAQHGSWARTAEQLHLHVNTVHYRVQRIERLTGRDLSRLDHKLDLQVALLCR
ncbi:PucR family transcriptional regulator [Streptomyces kronopolitis]